LENLEEIAKGFKGVESSYAIQAGREVRILVKPDMVSDSQLVILAHDISQRIENELDYPGQIKVNVVRESRAVDYAK
jgi:ribonuclease Y